MSDLLSEYLSNFTFTPSLAGVFVCLFVFLIDLKHQEREGRIGLRWILGRKVIRMGGGWLAQDSVKGQA